MISTKALVAILLIWIQIVQGKDIVYNFTISLGVPTPNCFGSPQVLVNGMSPGPTIYAKEGELLIINIENKLAKDEFTMHYHGFHQKGTPFYDGVPNISQHPIPPNKSYQHRIKLTGQYGTFLYHSHTKAHAKTALGAIIIEPKDPIPFKYDDEIVVFFSDNLLVSKSVDSHLDLNTPSILMVNGRPHVIGDYHYQNNDMEDSNPKAIDPLCKAMTYNVEPNKTYRVRIASGTIKEYLSFAIAGHVLEVIEVDGFYVNPTKLDKIPVHTGQRYSILIRTNNLSRSLFRIHAHSINRDGSTSLVALANLRYNRRARVPFNLSGKNPHNNTKISLTSLQPYNSNHRIEYQNNRIIDLNSKNLPFDLDWPMDFRTDKLSLKVASNLFTPLTPVPMPPVTKRFYFRLTHEEKEDEAATWFVNGTSIKMPKVNMLSEAYSNRTHQYDNTDFRAVHLDYKESIEVVIQNTVDLAGVCDNHPWHLHGHSFWDLGSGKGSYDPNATLNLNPNPILRDTFTFSLTLPIAGLTPKEDCGWHVIRFVADNPGLWLFHCHILQHMDYGMLIYFMEAENNLPALPQDIELM